MFNLSLLLGLLVALAVMVLWQECRLRQAESKGMKRSLGEPFRPAA
jgi:hypothetical protein